MEIDLLRAYPALPLGGVNAHYDYRILVSDAAPRPRADLYGFNLRVGGASPEENRLPPFSLPLQPDDAPILVDLQPLLQEVYEQGNFDLRIDYAQPVPAPALDEDDRAGVQTQLQS